MAFFLSSYFPGGPVAQALLKLPLHLSKLTPLGFGSPTCCLFLTLCCPLLAVSHCDTRVMKNEPWGYMADGRSFAHSFTLQHFLGDTGCQFWAWCIVSDTPLALRGLIV